MINDNKDRAVDMLKFLQEVILVMVYHNEHLSSPAQTGLYYIFDEIVKKIIIEV